MKEKRNKKEIHEDYEGFVDKFKPKKTTDDCYTPPEVYDCVLKWLSSRIDLTGRKILRPFFPGGDYRSETYPPDCVVIDNPPFSVFSEIVRFYTERGIGFFLFAPHLTLLSSNIDCTAVVCGTPVEYENKALVNTSFCSNLFGDIAILGVPDLFRALLKAQNKVQGLPTRYEYPPHVVTVSRIANCVHSGEQVVIRKRDVAFCRGLDSQREHKKAIYGSGRLISEAAESYLSQKERIAELRLVERMKEEKHILKWELSPREKEIVKKLG